jgi:hypothetical protein
MRRGWETPAGWSSVRQIRPMLPIAATAVDATSRAGWCTRRRSQCHPTKRVLVRLTRWAGWGRGEIRMMCGLIIARRALVRGRAADQQPHGTSDGHRQPHGRARPRPMYRPLWNIIIRTEILNWLRFTTIWRSGPLNCVAEQVAAAVTHHPRAVTSAMPSRARICLRYRAIGSPRIWARTHLCWCECSGRFFVRKSPFRLGVGGGSGARCTNLGHHGCLQGDHLGASGATSTAATVPAAAVASPPPSASRQLSLGQWIGPQGRRHQARQRHPHSAHKGAVLQ